MVYLVALIIFFIIYVIPLPQKLRQWVRQEILKAVVYTLAFLLVTYGKTIFTDPLSIFRHVTFSHFLLFGIPIALILFRKTSQIFYFLRETLIRWLGEPRRIRQKEKEKVSEKLVKLLKKYNFLRIYETKEDIAAEKKLFGFWKRLFSGANEVKISGIAQYEYVGKDYERYLEYLKNPKNSKPDFQGVLTDSLIDCISTKTRFLLLYPFESDQEAKTRVDEFIKERLDEINTGKQENDYVTLEQYRQDIITTYRMVQLLNQKRQKYKIQVVFYDSRPLFRYVIFPGKLFFSPYLPGRHGHETIVFEVKEAPLSLYHSFSKMFELQWQTYVNKFPENIL